MKKRNNKKVAKIVFLNSYNIEKKIVLNNDTKARYWANANAKRNAILLYHIQKFINYNKKSPVNILNASGIAAGQVDFVIAEYLKNTSKFAYNWHAIDSPNNSYLTNSVFKEKVKDLSVTLKLIDFNKPYKLNDLYANKFDIILFTEIAEHLDFSSFLNLLLQISQLLSNDGILIFTTPNLLSLGFRIKMLFGSTSGIFWGDGIENLKQGLFGHITSYDIGRLKYLLNEVGLEVSKSFTFDYAYKTGVINFLTRILKKIISIIFKNIYSTIFIIAEKTEKYHVMPFKI